MNQPTALLFPGQGSQYVGMGIKACDKHPIAAQTLQEANDVLGFDLSALCFAGPPELLTDTINAQPAILTVSVAYLRVAAASAEAEVAAAGWLAGHSLGEYTALVAAGSLSFADALKLVRERGRLMKEAGEETPGRMTAVIGLEVAPLEAICREASGEGLEVVQIAN
jgi:[acyl-carrier-protein] S-malonyltransferase